MKNSHQLFFIRRAKNDKSFPNRTKLVNGASYTDKKSTKKVKKVLR